jgi:hypothetical protein
MRATFKFVAAVATAAAFVTTVSLPAMAECKRYGFTVNDYGKDGPTKDAKALLDKLIASKMTERGITDFHTGKKTVSCELFLNFIVFDEHTCTAEATVCWGGSKLPKGDETAATDEAEPATTKKASTEKASEPKVTKKKDVAKKSEPAAEKNKTAALKVQDPKKPAVTAPAAAAQPSALPDASENTTASPPASETPSADTAAKSEAPAAAATTPVETGSLNAAESKPAAHHTAKPAHETSHVAPVEPSSDEGYPAPMGPAPQDDAPAP